MYWVVYYGWLQGHPQYKKLKSLGTDTGLLGLFLIIKNEHLLIHRLDSSRIFVLQDKLIEKERFDTRALSILENDVLETPELGSKLVDLVLRSPYTFYEEKIKELIRPTHKVLEIGSGTGLHTYSLIKTGAHVTATDISTHSLNVLKKNLFHSNTLSAIIPQKIIEDYLGKFMIDPVEYAHPLSMILTLAVFSDRYYQE